MLRKIQRLIPKKIWIFIGILYTIPFIFDRDVSYNTESLWVLYLIPSYIFSYYYGIRGGLISGVISSSIHFLWEYHQAMAGNRLTTPEIKMPSGIAVRIAEMRRCSSLSNT